MRPIDGRPVIRTQAGVVDARRSRTPQGALLEMASLEMERQRLLAESARLQRRSEQITHRVTEISHRQQHLQRFVNIGGATRETEVAPVSAAIPARTASSRPSRKLGY